jgi:outer membrane receptor protein involved in Fe transport
MLPVYSRFLGALVLFSASLLQAAEPNEAPQPVRYEAEFFAKFSPRTAWDMVKQVPSFSLRDVDEERRGYSGAAGNVLVDGEQPSAKSQTVEDILQRIPAAQVLRIEVLRGIETAGNASGDSVLVNIVRTPSAGAGYWSTGFEYAHQHEPAPNAYLSWTGRIGKVDYGLGATGYSLQRELPGTRRVTNGSGELTELRYETSPREFEEYAINGELSRDLFGGRLRATGQAYRSDYQQANTLENRSVDDVLLGDELAPYSEGKRTVEFGTHFESAIAAWDWTLAAIVTRSRFDSDARVTNRNASLAVESIFEQLHVRDTGESIVRTTFARPLGSAQQLQIGIEGALNTLDADLDLSGVFGGVEVPIEIPNANINVEEERSEAFVLHTWRGRAWSTEARLAAEYSRLDFSGDANQVVDLSYLKPALKLTRSFGKQHQVRARAFREVGQLDFADFASVASLSDEFVDGGNPDLKPETAWGLELGVDLRLGARTALGARVFHHWIEDVVDLVPLGDPYNRIAAPGNIGKGELDGLQLTFATPLSPLIPGGTLNLDATLQDASVEDPLTGQKRTISEFERNKIKAEFRQDTQRNGFAWGIKYVRESSQTDYRLDQTDRTRKSPSLDVFVERNVFDGVKLTLSLVSVQGSPELRRRAFYDGDRNGALLSVEDTERRPGKWVLVTVSGSI